MHNNSERTFRRCWPIIDFIICTSANTWSARVSVFAYTCACMDVHDIVGW